MYCPTIYRGVQMVWLGLSAGCDRDTIGLGHHPWLDCGHWAFTLYGVYSQLYTVSSDFPLKFVNYQLLTLYFSVKTINTGLYRPKCKLYCHHCTLCHSFCKCYFDPLCKYYNALHCRTLRYTVLYCTELNITVLFVSCIFSYLLKRLLDTDF